MRKQSNNIYTRNCLAVIAFFYQTISQQQISVNKFLCESKKIRDIFTLNEDVLHSVWLFYQLFTCEQNKLWDLNLSKFLFLRK